MKKATVSLVVGVVLLCGIRLKAYDNDTHYYFTFFLARLVGYTPLQAYRIASADVGIDAAEPTEPLQTWAFLTGQADRVHDRRVRFHAFQDWRLYGEGESPAGKQSIEAQQAALYARAITTRNPGVFLHFFQDTFAHERAKYASKAGHVFDGHVPDFLDFDHPAADSMARGTIAWLTRYMAECCPLQPPNQSLNFERDVMPVLEELFRANPNPGLADHNWERLKLATVKAEAAFPIIGAGLARGGAFDMPQALFASAMRQSDGQHLLQELNRLASQTSAVPHLDYRQPYAFDANGDPAENERDSFVVSGAIFVDVLNDSNRPLSGATVRATLEPRPDGSGGTVLGPGETTDALGQATFSDMPVGRYRFVISRTGFVSQSLEAAIDKRQNVVSASLAGLPPPVDAPPPQPPAKVTSWTISVDDADTGIDLSGATVEISGIARGGQHLKYDHIRSGETVPLPPGDYTATASSSGYDSRAVGTVLIAGAEDAETISLHALGGSLTVKVYDNVSHEPIANVPFLLSGAPGPMTASAPVTLPMPAGTYTVAVPGFTANGIEYVAAERSGIALAARGDTTVNIRVDRVPSALPPDAPPAAPGPAASIEIDHDSFSLNIGADDGLNAVVYDALHRAIRTAHVTWRSSDLTVATVDSNGIVVGTGRGVATITATFGGLSGSLRVTVAASPGVRSCRISNVPRGALPTRSDYVFQAEFRDPDGKIMPDVKFRWAASNDAVATVNAATGHALTRAAGKFRVWAQPVAESDFTAWCDAVITVSDAPPTPSAKPARPPKTIVPPVYLVRHWFPDQPDKVHFTMMKGVPRQEGDLFVLYDTDGMPWRYKGDYSGTYRDEASLCAVLRGYGESSVSSVNNIDIISCPADGPKAAPTNVVTSAAAAAAAGATSGGTGSTGSGPPVAPRAPRPPGFAIASTLGNSVYRVGASGTRLTLTAPGRVDPGSSVQTGTGSQIALTTAGHTTVTVNPETTIHIAPPPAPGTGTAVDLERGGIEVSHPAGAPDFDDVIVRFAEGTVQPTGTRYRVSRGPEGTDVEVVEGSVRLTGANNIIRLETPGGPPVGKSVPASALVLRAGERARLLNLNVAGPPSVARLDPWNDSRVQGLMDEWLRAAVPPTTTPGVVMHYNQWAQPLSQAATATSPPEHTGTRYQYLWDTRTKWTSTKLCTLGQFIDHRLANRPIDECASGLPTLPTKAAAPPPAPGATPGQQVIDNARRQLNSDTQKEKDRAGPPPVVPTASKPSSPDFSGTWTCTFDTGSSRFDGEYVISRSATAYAVVVGGDSNTRPTLQGEKLQVVKIGVGYTMTAVLEMRGDALVGPAWSDHGASSWKGSVACVSRGRPAVQTPPNQPPATPPLVTPPPQPPVDFTGTWYCTLLNLDPSRVTIVKTSSGYRETGPDGTSVDGTLQGSTLHFVATKRDSTQISDLERRGSTLVASVTTVFADGRRETAADAIVCRRSTKK